MNSLITLLCLAFVATSCIVQQVNCGAAASASAGGGASAAAATGSGGRDHPGYLNRVEHHHHRPTHYPNVGHQPAYYPNAAHQPAYYPANNDYSHYPANHAHVSPYVGHIPYQPGQGLYGIVGAHHQKRHRFGRRARYEVTPVYAAQNGHYPVY